MNPDPPQESPEAPPGDTPLSAEVPSTAGVFYRTRWRSTDPLWVIAFLVIYLGLGWLVSRFSDFAHRPETRFFLLFLLLAMEAGLPILVLVFRRRKSGAAANLKTRAGDLASGCGTYLGLLPGLVLLSLILNSLYPESLADRIGILRDKSFAFQVVLGIAAFTVVPVCEEVFFRGFLFNALKVRLRAGAAIVLQAAIFASLHFYTPTYPLYIFWVGLGLGWIYEKRKRLLAPIATHVTFNLLGSLLVLASAYFNQHQPAATWEQARDVLSPPGTELQYILQRELENSEPEDLMDQIETILGKEGLGIWKLEAEFYRALAFELEPENLEGGRALLRAGQIYFDHEDPRRALLLCQEVESRWNAHPDLVDRAKLLSRGIGLDLMLENPQAEVLDLGAPQKDLEEPKEP